MYKLRPYQQECVGISIAWVKQNTLGAVCELSGGSGKSIIIAEVAKRLTEMTGKYVLVIVPNVDLLYQNCEKLKGIGAEFSIYSASASQKSMRHKIVVTTEGTWKKVALEFGERFCAVIVDEGDRTTETLKQIMDDMRTTNPLVRLLAYTGTPFRLKTGHVYEVDLNNRVLDSDEAINPFYKKLIFRLPCNDLIAMGYLTPVTIGVSDQAYDTDNLVIKDEDFTTKSLIEAFEGKASKTKLIIDDVIEKTKNRKGVMIFASTLKHAEEICSYLPKESYVNLHGKLSQKERKSAIAKFKNQEVKYLVNKDIATVGFDAPHCDCIVLMRATSSNRLFQQIVWRSVRLYEGKTESLLLDYANNIKNLFDGSEDIFTPVIKTYGSKPSKKIDVTCPDCGMSQQATHRDKFELYNEYGYAMDQFGDVLKADDGQQFPAHFMRRCTGEVPLGKNKFNRCGYFWSHKTCPECGEKADIAARNCNACGFTLIAPDAKLSESAIVLSTGDKLITNVKSWEIKASKEITIVTFDTDHGKIKEKFYPNNKNRFVAHHAVVFDRATNCGEIMPNRIEYTLTKSGNYHVTRYLR